MKPRDIFLHPLARSGAERSPRSRATSLTGRIAGPGYFADRFISFCPNSRMRLALKAAPPNVLIFLRRRLGAENIWLN